MSKLTLVGQMTQIGEVQEFGENGFKKQEVIIKTVEEFSNFYVVEFTKDKIELLKEFKAGQNVKITCNLKGREYTSDEGKYNVFMSVNAWKIELLS